MNAPVTDITAATELAHPLAKLRAPFPAHQISKLPKPLAKREEMDKLPKAKCAECGGYHATSKIIHLDYVGHAALTDRLLDVDPAWTWEPCGTTPDGLPLFDKVGGLWIKLTVCGVTRLGYGSADGKQGGDAVKEVIGDALRNAAMRFGAALDLWHKGDLHAADDEPPAKTLSLEETALQHLRACAVDRAMLAEAWNKNKPRWKAAMDRETYGRVVAEVTRLVEALPKDEPPPPPPPAADDFGIGPDEIPF